MLYAIRQISTGWFLPYPKGRNGRGGSWVEPEPCHNKRVRTLSKRGANTCLVRWLEGHWVQDYDGEESWPNKVHSRNKADMEVVPVEMMESDKGFGPVYLIRHKVTGKYFSVKKPYWDTESRTYKPSSWAEPTEPDKENAAIFKYYYAARRFLVPWLRGKTEMEFIDSFDDIYYLGNFKVIPGMRRHKADYEIVLFTHRVI